MATPNYKNDRAKVMGFDCVCACSRDAGDGVHVEFWIAKNRVDVYIVRIVDRDAGSLVGLTKFEGTDTAYLADKYYRSNVV